MSPRRLALASTLATFAALALTAAPAQAAGTETLKLSVTGAGRVEGPEGISCEEGGGTCEAKFESNALITLTAVPTERSTFNHWTGCEENPRPTQCKVRINTFAETDVSAEFSPRTQEKLTVANPGSGVGGGFISGSRPGPEFNRIRCGDQEEECEQEYSQGMTVTLEVSPNQRSEFLGWTGCTSEPSPTECKVEMTEAKTVKAKLAPIEQEVLTVATEGTGAGQISASPGGEFPALECGNGATACTAEYNKGAKLTLTASPATYSRFGGWKNCPNVLSSNEFSASECEVPDLTAATEVKAQFAPIPQKTLEVSVTGPGEVNSSPAGISSCAEGGGTCSGHFDSEGPEATVTLSASPAADNHLEKWEGACSGTTTCEVTMSAAHSVKALFATTFQELSVSRTGSGEITSSPSGIACNEDLCEHEFPEGLTVTLTAHPGPHRQLGAWSGCTEEPTPTECEVQIGSSTTEVKAEFTPIVQPLTVVPNSGGSVSASEGAISACTRSGGTCTAEYDEASTQTLTATPGPHYSFKEWEAGDCKAELGPHNEKCEVEVGTSPAEVHSTFAPITHTLTLTPLGPGSVKATSGTIDNCSEGGGTCSGTYLEAATPLLVASPGPGQAVAWEGCTAAEEDTCEVQIGASDATVKATFSPLTHALTLTKAGAGQGTLACNGAPCAARYSQGTALTLTASPASGSTFAGWSGGGCSGTGTCHLTMQADTTLTATFNANPPPPVEEHCVVPALAGKTLSQARSALTAAHCALGTVIKPKPKKHHKLGPLVVKSSSPPAGTTLPAGNKVNLTLGPKPKKKGKK